MQIQAITMTACSIAAGMAMVYVRRFKPFLLGGLIVRVMCVALDFQCIVSSLELIWLIKVDVLSWSIPEEQTRQVQKSSLHRYFKAQEVE